MRADPPGPTPTGTYRVQLTPTHGFDSLDTLAPHLARLGVSHAYLSPVLAAAPGSQHGYDVVDHSRINAELGGEPGLRRAAEHLRAVGISVLLDLVPNHMALTTPEYLNEVLWGALRDGAKSPYARWLDVDWAQDRPLLMPVLGRRIDQCLDAEEIILDPTGGPGGEPVLRYFEHVLPVRAGTAQLALEDLLGAQHYRLAYWRTAHEELNYRRFFDVDTLIAIRVEDEDVFAATHAVPVRLVREGVVSGLRIDHPDGLTDPVGYLRRVAAATGNAWVVVEKILLRDEELPADWECDGTTGYEALRRIGALFIDPDGAPVLRGAFAEFTGIYRTWEQTAEQSRRDVLRGLLVAEVDRLARVAYEVCQDSVRLRDHSLRGLTEAVYEMLVAIPIYRAYVRPGEPADDVAVATLTAAAHSAVGAQPDREAEIGLVRDLALGRLGRSPRKDEFCLRFQQTSGPAIAKGIEDTAGYRWFPLVSLAEVGDEPSQFGVDLTDFHQWAERRRVTAPFSLTALSTHDTKRSEDVRARLAALAEIPGEWATTVRAWRDLVGGIEAPRVAEVERDVTSAPPSGLEWLAWQTLVGAWPMTAERLGTYLVKAAREAKQATSWMRPDAGVEAALADFAKRLTRDPALVGSLTQFVDRLHPAFVANVLGQRAVQLVLPGVPDIYQGCEIVSLRLVDPDNRDPVEASTLTAALERGLAAVPNPTTDLDAAKARLTARGLALRRDRPELLGPAAHHHQVAVTGPAADHAVAIGRGEDLVLVVTRFALQLARSGGWRDTTVALPRGRWRCVLTDTELESTGDGVALTEVLAHWPVTLLVRVAR